MKKLFTAFFFMLLASWSFAQTVLSGKVVDVDSQEPLIGASVLLANSSTGTITDFDGNFTLRVGETESGELVITYIGYQEQKVSFSSAKNDLGVISMSANGVGLDEIEVVASIAIDRKTPVAVSTLNAERVEETLGSKELPEVLNSTPSVYATKGGGGYGDSRINIRGFDQRNVAVMINGVPVNDMENGWVYWSNWAGLGDAVRTMQVQRGLGASKLAINSAGGTMNILTKTSDAEKGGVLKQELNSYGTKKTLIGLNSGMMENNMAISFVGSRTSGPGYVDGTYIDAWSYYLSLYKELNDDHSLQFTVIGAPQKHGQRDNSRFSAQSFEEFDQNGSRYNPNWGYAKGEFLNERNNYYHKPQISLNHYWTMNESNFLATSAYVSTGNGGGSGVLGKSNGTNGIYMQYGPGQNALGQREWDNAVAVNDTSSIGSYLIMRNSVNNHFWTGILSSLNSDLTNSVKLIAGIDGRYYKGEHYREVRDLLGGSHWEDAVTPEAQVGDRIAYDNDGIVTYGGAFAQLEYSQGPLSAFVGGTVSNTWFGRTDRYNFARGRGELEAETVTRLGYNGKAGVNYNINKNHNVYANAGFYSRAPFHNFIYVNFSNTLNPVEDNEKILGLELGYGVNYSKFRMNINAYRTDWQDRWVRSRVDYIDTDGNIQNATSYFQVTSQLHQGIEIDARYKPAKGWEIGAFGSVGDWVYNGDIDADLFDEGTREKIGTVRGYVDGLKVADQAQTSFGAILDYRGPKFSFGANYTFYDNLYAKFDVTTINDAEDKVQSYELPSYGMLDARIAYKFDFAGFDAKFYIQGNNLLNELTPVEGWNNAQRNADGDYLSGADNFKGFWTRERNFNFGMKIMF